MCWIVQQCQLLVHLFFRSELLPSAARDVVDGGETQDEMLLHLESRPARARARVTSNVLWFLVNALNSESRFLQSSPHSPWHLGASVACK